jgi:heme-degrading monooxygenase HmoA
MKKHSLFLENFESIKKRIRCALEIVFIRVISGQRQQKYFFTYSYWETEEDLENYRNSEFLMKFGVLPKIIQENLRLEWIN